MLMLENWRDGRIKLAVIKGLLAHPRDHPQLFAEGRHAAECHRLQSRSSLRRFANP
jgi:hypothetical protein